MEKLIENTPNLMHHLGISVEESLTSCQGFRFLSKHVVLDFAVPGFDRLLAGDVVVGV